MKRTLVDSESKMLDTWLRAPLLNLYILCLVASRVVCSILGSRLGTCQKKYVSQFQDWIGHIVRVAESDRSIKQILGKASVCSCGCGFRLGSRVALTGTEGGLRVQHCC